MNSQKPLKIYILIKDSVPVGHAVNCAAHASLALYLDHQGCPLVRDWLASFKKVSCKVTDEQFAEAKSLPLRRSVITESALGGQEVAIAFTPQYDWPPFFKTLKLYS